jgi:hypothetical protein
MWHKDSVILERHRAGQTDGGAGSQLCERPREDAGEDASRIRAQCRTYPDLSGAAQR